jgi:hypothetical protein
LERRSSAKPDIYLSFERIKQNPASNGVQADAGQLTQPFSACALRALQTRLANGG